MIDEGREAPGGLSRRRALSLGASGLVVLCIGCSDAGSEKVPSAAEPVQPLAPGEFGTVIDAGSLREIDRDFAEVRWRYIPEARTYLVRYPVEKVAAAKLMYPKVLHAGLDAGLLAMYQKCTHLGCRVPVCATSGMLECPCHNGVFSAYGEWRAGPPPRGLDLFAIEIRRGRILLDTAHVVPGLDKTVDVSGQIAEGPHCI